MRSRPLFSRRNQRGKRTNGILRASRLAICFAALFPLVASSILAGPIVRIGYVIPQDRVEQAGAVERLQQLALSVQDWYSNQMDRHGFGPKTFALELLPDGVTPKVHVVTSTMSAATMRTDTWDRPIEAASDAGLSIWTPGEVWLLAPYSHLQQSSGAISGNTALGASNGSGNDPGVAVTGSDFSFRSTPTALSDTRPYAGITNPLVGRYPFVQNVTFPAFEGSTISSIASAAQGATAHELGHAFGLAHDFRNDSNFDGNLMGNGLRGWRGSQLPELFPDDDVYLSYASALALNTSRYFNSDQTFTDQVRPTLSIQTSGAVDPIDGQLKIAFTASDSTALSTALLERNGETIGEMRLRGSSVATAFSTPFYTPGQNDQFTISIFDTQGNRREANVTITPRTGFNRAPQPFIDLELSTVTVGQPVLLSAAQSTDPDGSASSMLVEWDLNGDGVFDTSPVTTKTLTNAFGQPGNFRVSARLTDALGASALATPLVIQVLPLPGDYNSNGIVDAPDYTLWRDTLGQAGDTLAADGDRDGYVSLADYEIWKSHFGNKVASHATELGAISMEGVSPVPEPAGGAILLAAGATILATYGRWTK